MKTRYLERPVSDAIKGVVLIFMFIHHFFMFPEWYVAGISYPGLSFFVRILRWPLKICVSVFAFLTGYFYYLGEQKTYRYSFRKITDILISYWAVYIPFLILAMVLGYHQFDAAAFALEAFALETTVMQFCWYVFFYCISMLLLPMAAKFSTGSLWTDVLLMGLLPVVAFTGLQQLTSAEIPGSVIASMKEWFPCMISGFLFAKYALFENALDEISGKCRSGWGKILLWLLMVGAACIGRSAYPRFSPGRISVLGEWTDLVINMDVFYAPLFVYGAANLLKLLKGNAVVKLLGRIGKQSLFMWFLHGIFFNVCKETTQPFLYCLRNPLLVLVFGLAVCYLAAVLINIPLKRILKLKNKYM